MTKVVTIYEDAEAERIVTIAEEKDTSSDSNGMIIIATAAIVGFLVLIAVIMAIRFCSKRNSKEQQIAEVKAVKTEVVEVDVEPQFVLEADDSKNIFGARTSTAMPFGSDIEKSEDKKTKKKRVIRKKKSNGRPGSSASSAAGSAMSSKGFSASHSSSFTPVKEEVKEEEHDDGFNSFQNETASKFLNNYAQQNQAVNLNGTQGLKTSAINLKKVNDDEF